MIFMELSLELKDWADERLELVSGMLDITERLFDPELPEEEIEGLVEERGALINQVDAIETTVRNHIGLLGTPLRDSALDAWAGRDTYEYFAAIAAVIRETAELGSRIMARSSEALVHLSKRSAVLKEEMRDMRNSLNVMDKYMSNPTQTGMFFDKKE